MVREVVRSLKEIIQRAIDDGYFGEEVVSVDLISGEPTLGLDIDGDQYFVTVEPVTVDAEEDEDEDDGA